MLMLRYPEVIFCTDITAGVPSSSGFIDTVFGEFVCRPQDEDHRQQEGCQ